MRGKPQEAFMYVPGDLKRGWGGGDSRGGWSREFEVGRGDLQITVYPSFLLGPWGVGGVLPS